MHIKTFVLTSAFLAINYSGVSSVWAHEKDQPFRLGAFAGAMNYCGDRHEDRQRRYRWAQLRAAHEVSSMHQSDRLRALAARNKALERGQFFGASLNAQSCKRLLRAGEWQRFFKP
jgi:hypothetical protein